MIISYGRLIEDQRMYTRILTGKMVSKSRRKKPGVQPDFEISRNQDALRVAIESIQRAAELQSNVSNHSSTARLMTRHNFTSSPVQSYPLSKQKNLSDSQHTTSSSNASASLEEKSDPSLHHSGKSTTAKEMKDKQNSEQSAASPFKNLSGTPRFTREN